jgi:hypothetical protein
MIRHQLGYAVGDHGIYGWWFAALDMKLISIASELGFGWRQRLTKQTMLVSEQYIELYRVRALNARIQSMRAITKTPLLSRKKHHTQREPDFWNSVVFSCSNGRS